MTEHPIHLVTSRKGGVLDEVVDNRVVRIVLDRRRASGSILRLAAYIRREHPVGMISTLDYANVVFLLSTTITRVPLRKVVRDASIVRSGFGSFSAGFGPAVLRWMMRFSYRLADDIIIIAEDVGNSLLSHGIGDARKFRRIPNPVLRSTPLQQSAGIRCSPPRKFILGIGRLAYVKGFDVLIKALAKLQQPNLDLVLLGEGPDKGLLSGLAENLGVADRVFFPGFVHDVSAYLSSAELFVLSSRWEGFSNVLIEALASGTPIVSTDCPGSPREVLHEGRLGRLVSSENHVELADAIKQELESPTAHRYERIARAADFAPTRIASQYLNVLLGIPHINPSQLAATEVTRLANE